jgi:hypothetical protein
MAFDYCCSLGLQMPEFSTVQEMRAALNGIKMTLAILIERILYCHVSVLNSVSRSSDALFFIGETYIDGQQRDVWCRSKTPITDMNLHFGGSQFRQGGGEPFTKSSSCYFGYYSGTGGNAFGLILFGDSCVLSTTTYRGIFFLCE